MSTRPNSSTALRTRFAISSAELTSVLTKIARLPLCLIMSSVLTSVSAATRERASGRRSAHTTCAPSREYASAMALPRPEEEPVTMATLLTSRCVVVIVAWLILFSIAGIGGSGDFDRVVVEREEN